MCKTLSLAPDLRGGLQGADSDRKSPRSSGRNNSASWLCQNRWRCKRWVGGMHVHVGSGPGSTSASAAMAVSLAAGRVCCMYVSGARILGHHTQGGHEAAVVAGVRANQVRYKTM